MTLCLSKVNQVKDLVEDLRKELEKNSLYWRIGRRREKLEKRFYKKVNKRLQIAAGPYREARLVETIQARDTAQEYRNAKVATISFRGYWDWRACEEGKELDNILEDYRLLIDSLETDEESTYVLPCEVRQSIWDDAWNSEEGVRLQVIKDLTEQAFQKFFEEFGHIDYDTPARSLVELLGLEVSNFSLGWGCADCKKIAHLAEEWLLDQEEILEECAA